MPFLGGQISGVKLCPSKNERSKSTFGIVVIMMTHQISTLQDAREKARKALTDYLTMYIPESWKDPLEKLRLILQANGEPDWEAMKGFALIMFDEKRLSDDRVESLARIERLGEDFRVLYTISPPDWHKTVNDIIHAAVFRASKAAVQLRHIRITTENPVEEDEED